MEWGFMLFLFITGHFSMTQAACSPPIKFYIDCGTTGAANSANQFCLNHQMTIVNLTNGTASLLSDIALLNTTFNAMNCTGYFWYSSGSHVGLAASVNALSDVLSFLTNIVSTVVCNIPLLCPASTTIAPILDAFTICTRPIQQNVVQKCATPVQRFDMQQFRFNEQSMQAGVLDTFSSSSSMACSGICSSNNVCVGMSFNKGTCTLYM